MNNRFLNIVFTILLVILIASLPFYAFFLINDDKQKTYILHAGGGSNNLTYLNSEETFEIYYNQGYRVFEYDFELSTDNKMIGTHDYNYIDQYSNSNSFNYDEFKQLKINHEYTPITEDWLINILINYDDIKVVLDTKHNEIEIYERLNNIQQELNISFKDKIIPQLYSKEMWDLMKDKYDYSEYIFSNYKCNYSIDQILEYFKDERITSITLSIKYSSLIPFQINKLSKRKKVYIHTVNNRLLRKYYTLVGVSGFYTDFPKNII